VRCPRVRESEHDYSEYGEPALDDLHNTALGAAYRGKGGWVLISRQVAIDLLNRIGQPCGVDRYWTRRELMPRPVAAQGDHQIPGTSSLVLAIYAAYSSPNVSSIIRSSAPIRRAKRIPNVTKYDGPTTQFGTTSACPME
jgi:hypothetical protein